MSGSEDEIYAVERIVTDRSTKRGKQYLIKWEGFPDSQNSWVFARDIFDKSLIEAYEKSKKLGNKKVEEKRPTITNEWDKTVDEILCIQEGEKGLEAQISFKDGRTLVVPINAVHEKCPLRLIEFYEKNINFIATTED